MRLMTDPGDISLQGAFSMLLKISVRNYILLVCKINIASYIERDRACNIIPSNYRIKAPNP